MNKNNGRLLIMAVAMILVSQVACGQQVKRVRLDGYSMGPNFSDGQIFKIEEVSVTELKRGDVIMVEVDGNLLIKRLIGLPSETVSIHDGEVFINGTLLTESYEVVPPPYTMDEIKLVDDSYFVLGDNRPDSKDSHSFGPIKGDQIKGKAIPE